MRSFDHLLMSDDGAVRIVTLNRPEKKNAVSPRLAVDLRDELDELTAESWGLVDRVFPAAETTQRIGETAAS